MTDFSGLEPPADEWTVEGYDPDVDDPPADHESGIDPPDLPREKAVSPLVTALIVAAFVTVLLVVWVVV